MVITEPLKFDKTVEPYWDRYAREVAERKAEEKARKEHWKVVVANMRRGLPWGVEAMPAMPYARYIKSKWWKLLRDARLELDGYRCVYCGSGAWQGHHIFYPDDFRDDRLDNIRSVCGSCHVERSRGGPLYGGPNGVFIPDPAVKRAVRRKHIVLVPAEQDRFDDEPPANRWYDENAAKSSVL